MSFMFISQNELYYSCIYEYGNVWAWHGQGGKPAWADLIPVVIEEGVEDKAVFVATMGNYTYQDHSTEEIKDLLWLFEQTKIEVGTYDIRPLFNEMVDLQDLRIFILTEKGHRVVISTLNYKLYVMLYKNIEGNPPDGLLYTGKQPWNKVGDAFGINCPVANFKWAMLEDNRPTTPKMIRYYQREDDKEGVLKLDYTQEDIDQWMKMYDEKMGTLV